MPGLVPLCWRWQLYFSGGLNLSCLAGSAQRVGDCDRLSCDRRNDALVRFAGGAESVGESRQDALCLEDRRDPVAEVRLLHFVDVYVFRRAGTVVVKQNGTSHLVIRELPPEIWTLT